MFFRNVRLLIKCRVCEVLVTNLNQHMLQRHPAAPVTKEQLEQLGNQGGNSIDIKNLGPVSGPVLGPKLGQTFKDVSICFQVVHTYILFNLTSRASFRAHFRATNYVN